MPGDNSMSDKLEKCRVGEKQGNFHYYEYIKFSTAKTKLKKMISLVNFTIYDFFLA